MSSVIGVDLGGTKVVVACLRGRGIVDSALLPTDRSGSGAGSRSASAEVRSDVWIT